MEDIIYDKFMSEKTILHSDTVTNYSDGILFLLENESNADMITYNKTDKFLLLSVGVLNVDENNNYYYEYSVKRTGDIIDNIRIECQNKIKVSYYIGGCQYHPDVVEQFIPVSAIYHDFTIRITFLEKPTNEIEFVIYSRIYLLGKEHRKNMARNTIITKSNIYRNGMCGQLNNFTRGGGSLEEYKAYVDDK
jgi:hypothetical protein